MITASTLPFSIWSRLSPGLHVMVIGGAVYSAASEPWNRSPSASIRLRANQRHEFVDAFGGLSDGPVVAEANDERSHFGVGPLTNAKS